MDWRLMFNLSCGWLYRGKNQDSRRSQFITKWQLATNDQSDLLDLRLSVGIPRIQEKLKDTDNKSYYSASIIEVI